MRLEQKYFVPFIAAGAVLTMIFIVFSSFNFKEQQADRFHEYATQYDSLLVVPNPYITESDSLRLGDLNGKNKVVLFWASWSDRSENIMNELSVLKDSSPELEIVAALVHDATDTAIPEIPAHDFHFIDGSLLFNELRVPGIPSYFLLDKEGDLIDTHVGYQKGEVQTILHRFSD